jgi:succinate dehydrogenase / fumarate reductase cytochrome b subunit
LGRLSCHLDRRKLSANLIEGVITLNTDHPLKKNRPINLDLATVQFPITALVSITHRITGVIMLAGVIILMWMLDTSLASQTSFTALLELLKQPLVKFVVWAVMASLAFHLTMGMRHLVMDLGYGESLKGGRVGAQIALAGAGLLIAAAALWVIQW